MNLLREYIRELLAEDPMGFVQDLAAATDEFGVGDFEWFGGNPGKGGGRAIKRAFNAHADHQWLATLDTVHWSHAYNLAELVGKGKDEMSTAMTLPGESFTPMPGERVGLWIKGRITLAANNMDELYSGHSWEYGPGKSLGGTEEEVAHRDRSSGRNKRPTTSKDYSRYGRLKRSSELHREMARNIPYVLDQSMWEEYAGVGNEALVDNWRPVGIVVPEANNLMASVKAFDNIEPEDIEDIGAGTTKKIFEMAIEFGVPIYDTEREILWSPE